MCHLRKESFIHSHETYFIRAEMVEYSRFGTDVELLFIYYLRTGRDGQYFYYTCMYLKYVFPLLLSILSFLIERAERKMVRDW